MDIVYHELDKNIWNESAFCEDMMVNPCMWIGSTVSLPTAAPRDNDALAPMQGEQSVQIDWSLPLSADGQGHLFNRIVGDYERDTAIVPTGAKK
eukprot:1729839-Alexandrium_andersonii.AAC.1